MRAVERGDVHTRRVDCQVRIDRQAGIVLHDTPPLVVGFVRQVIGRRIPRQRRVGQSLQVKHAVIWCGAGDAQFGLLVEGHVIAFFTSGTGVTALAACAFSTPIEFAIGRPFDLLTLQFTQLVTDNRFADIEVVDRDCNCWHDDRGIGLPVAGEIVTVTRVACHHISIPIRRGREKDFIHAVRQDCCPARRHCARRAIAARWGRATAAIQSAAPARATAGRACSESGVGSGVTGVESTDGGQKPRSAGHTRQCAADTERPASPTTANRPGMMGAMPTSSSDTGVVFAR